MKVLAALMAFAIADVAAACPCGCGTIATGTLEPGQTAKVVTTGAVESELETIGPDGSELGEYYYDRTERASLSLTHALRRDVNVTIGANVFRNTRDGHSTRTLPGDPSFSIGKALLRHDFTRPFLPSLDVDVSYKHPVAKSFEDAADDSTEENFLQVGGNGLQEVSTGALVDFGQETWSFGARLLAVTFPEVLQGKKAGPDRAGSAAGRLGHTWMGRGSVGAEAGIEWIGDVVDAGEQLRGTSRSIDHLELWSSIVVFPQHSVGLSFTRKNAFGLTRNSVASRTVSVSYQAVFL